MGKGHGGLVGGDQVGFNYMPTPAFLIGIETDIQAADLHQTGNLTNVNHVPGSGSPLATWQTQIAASHSIDYLGTLRGRIGSTLISDWLFYGTGGLAYGRVSSSTSISQGVAGSPPASTVSGTFDATRIGWAAGVGAEWMFGSNWSAKLEYMHFDLGSAAYSNGTLAFDVGTVASPFNGTGISSIASTSSARFNGDLVRVGVNYRLH